MKYKIDLTNEKKSMILPITFLVISFIFLIISTILFVHSNNRVSRMDSLIETYNIESLSYETNNKTMYKYIYHYMVDDKKYICKSNMLIDKKNDLKSTIIEYNSKNPSECMIPDDKYGINTLLLVFVILGIILILIGFIVVLIKLKNIISKKNLSKNGLLIKNVPYEMVESNVTINGKTLYMIEAIITLENGNMIEVNSAPRYDKKYSDNDNHVDVLINKNNPNINYIDFNIDEIN